MQRIKRVQGHCGKDFIQVGYMQDGDIHCERLSKNMSSIS